MSDDDILSEAVRRIREQFNPRKILLFGSRARGEARQDSDFDLMVVMDDPGDWRTPGLMHGALRGLRGDFDILVTSSEVWERRHVFRPTFECQIAQYAKDLLHAA